MASEVKFDTSRWAELASRFDDMAERMAKGGLEIWDLAPEALAALMRQDHARWQKVVKVANLAQ